MGVICVTFQHHLSLVDRDDDFELTLILRQKNYRENHFDIDELRRTGVVNAGNPTADLYCIIGQLEPDRENWRWDDGSFYFR